MHFGWVRFNIEISKVTGPNFTVLVSPNAGGIAVNGIKIRFWISSSVSEIFAAELRSRPKSGQILHVFRPRNFFGVRPPKFWTGIIKFGLVLTIVQCFKPVGPRTSEISRSEKNLKKNIWAKKISPLRKLSLPGGLKNTTKPYRRNKFKSRDRLRNNLRAKRAKNFLNCFVRKIVTLKLKIPWGGWAR